MKKKVLILGGSGLVGSHITNSISQYFNVIFPSHQELDIANYSQIRDYINEKKPQIIINSAGMASMELAEENPDSAFNLNVNAVEYLANLADKKKIPLLHISTDAVFDGIKKRSPFSENLKTNPISVYSKTKASGEDYVLQSKNNCLIRITLPYANYFIKRSDRVRDMIIALKSGKEYMGITDQIINPISMIDVAKAIKTLLINDANGIYHIAASNSMSNYEFLIYCANLFLLDANRITKVKLKEFLIGKKAHRSAYCVLGVERFNKDFYILPTVEESLEKFANKFAF